MRRNNSLAPGHQSLSKINKNSSGTAYEAQPGGKKRMQEKINQRRVSNPRLWQGNNIQLIAKHKTYSTRAGRHVQRRCEVRVGVVSPMQKT